ncbi:MAG: DsbA family protein [Nannocystales bacterium]
MLGRLTPILLLVAVGCDTPDRVEGLERVAATLEEGVIGATKDAQSLREDIELLETRATELEADRRALEERVESLETALARVEAKLDAPVALPPAAPAEPTVRPGRPDPAERYRVPVGDSAAKGPADAKITLVMITDFQCPFCKRSQATIQALERRYGSDLRIVVKHNPLAFHNRARAAALAAEAANEQGKFWPLHDLLYENNRSLSDADLRRWAKKAGCEMSRFRADQNKASLARRVDDDIALARKVGARGTPAFFINGRFLSGAQPESAFAKVIDEEIAEADRRIAAGTPQDFLYATLMKGAKPGV